MARFSRLSDVCILDHQVRFTGLRGWIWRLRGVTRGDKNPNICNM